jgi:hypothetical protein
MADYTLTVYQADDSTPLFEVGTAASHAHPYLRTPDQFGEAETDLQAGKAMIAQLNVAIIDPQTGADQTERFLTGLLGAASGFSAINGARALFQQVSPSTVVVLDGVGFGVTLSDSFAGFQLQVRDIRERGRKVSVFSRSGTASVFPRGVIAGYGLLPTGAWLAPPTVALHGTYHLETTGIFWSVGRIDLDQAPTKAGTVVPSRLALTDAMLSVLGHTASTPGGLGYSIYDQVTVLWRVEGSGGAWTEMSRMSSLFDEGRGIVPWLSSKVKLSDGSTADVRGATKILISNSGLGALPTNGARVEVMIRYEGPPTDAYPFHFEGTWGTFARNLLRGDYCGLDETGIPTNPRIRYDASALTSTTGPLAVPIRVRLTKPSEDLRTVLEELCKPIGAAPALNAAGEISPIRYAVPDASVSLPEINDSNAQPIPGWSHPTDNAVTVVEVTYPRDFLVPSDADPLGQRSAGDGLSSRDVVIRRAPSNLVAALGEHELKIDAWMFRALGGIQGEALNGDVTQEAGSQLAVERQHQALDRFGFGGVSSFVKLSASDFPTVKAGDWALDARSWRPNYQSGKRGGNALVQIVSVRRLNPAWWEARLIDAGPGDTPLGQPTLGTVTASAAGVVSVPVSALPTGGEARADYAISATLPAASSPLWTFLGRTAVTATLVSPALPAGVTVWVRSRGEAVGRRPSAWTNAVSVTLTGEPRVLSAGLSVDAAGAAVVTWTANAAAAGMRVYYAKFTGTAPTLTTFVDVVGTAGTTTLPVTLAPGESVAVELEPWTGWSGSAVSGTAGSRVARAASLAAAPIDAPDGVITPVLNHVAATASAEVTGNALVGSIKIAASTSGTPSAATVRAATAINSRSATAAAVGALLSGLAPNTPVFYAGFVYTGSGGTGTESALLTAKASYGVGTNGISDNSLTTPKYVAGSVVAGKLTESSQGFNSSILFSASSYNTVNWAAGTLVLADGSSYSIGSGSTGGMSVETFIYFDPSISTSALQATTNVATVSGDRRLLVAYARPSADTAQRAMYVPAVGLLGVNGDNLQLNSVKAVHVQAGEINATHVSSIYLSVIQATVTDLSTINARTGTLVVDLSGSGKLQFANGTTLYAEVLSYSNLLGLGIEWRLYSATSLGTYSTVRMQYNTGATRAELDINGDLVVANDFYLTGLVEIGAKWFVRKSPDAYADLEFCFTSAGHTPRFLMRDTGNAYAEGGSWVDLSDERLKRGVAPLLGTRARDALRMLAGIEYSRHGRGEREVGFSAQAVQAVVPEAVSVAGTVEGVPNALGVAYGRLVPVLWTAAREIDRDVMDLQSEMQRLRQLIRGASSLSALQAALS